MNTNLRLFLTSLILLCAIIIKAQEPEKAKIEFKPYGYVTYEIIFDTYKSLDARDGELYFYPLKANLDLSGRDLNKRNQLQMLSLSSRIGGKISGPNVLGAKMTGIIEADFFATSNDYARLLGLRLAIVNLKWEKSELLMGHYSHPIVVSEVIPLPISFGAGVPFHSLNRSPQIRFTYYPSESIRLSATALTQGYHRSVGPTEAQRNSGLPELMAQASFGNRKTFILGMAAGYKWLTPRTVTLTGYKTTEKIGQYILSAFAMGKIGSTVIKANVVYGENPTSLQMIGGYGYKTGTELAPDNNYEYVNLKTLSTWADLQHSIGKTGLGLFAGYSKLMGANDNYTNLYSRNHDLNYIYRVSPRITYKEENLTFAFEYMITAAVYGTTWDSKYKVTSSQDPVYNNRFTIAAKYDF